MRILHLMFSRVRGGLEQAFIDYTHALQSRGHEVIAVCDPDAAISGYLNDVACPVVALRCRGMYDFHAFRCLRQLIDHYKPGAVIAHNGKAMHMLAKAAVKHELLRIGVSHAGKAKRCEGMDILITVNQAMQSAFRTAGYDVHQLYMIPNVLADVRPVERPPVLRDGEVPVIGAMGRLTPEKGWNELLNALELMRSRGKPFECWIAGEGPLQKELHERVALLGLKDHVRFLGWVGDKAAFFSHIDVTVLPSLHESFGLAILESWRYGVPVIATACDGPTALIQHEDNGLLVRPGDAEALARALTQAQMEPNKMRAIGLNGQQCVVDYNMDRLADQLDQLLTSAEKHTHAEMAGQVTALQD